MKQSRQANRVVVKVGSSTLTDLAGRLNRPFIADLATQLAAERALGCDVVLVSSGAIAAGREVLPDTPDAGAPAALRTTLPFKQAAAAIGQGRLIHTYTEAFGWRNARCAQVLLTREDLSDRQRFLNARNTLLALLDLAVIPVINENDTVATDEIRFGDNDTLAALVATLLDADLLLILSDVEGLYERPPAEGAELPPVVPVVDRVDAAVMRLAGGSQSRMGTGGMKTKLQAARIATGAGIRTVIARGCRANVVRDVLHGIAVGTTFLPCPDTERLPARKRWIAHGARPRGRLVVNDRARARLEQTGVSLLAVGVTAVSGSFSSGDLVEVADPEGCVFARGLVNYAAAELRRLAGHHSDEFESVLGYAGCDEVIHRDNLVVEDR